MNMLSIEFDLKLLMALYLVTYQTTVLASDNDHLLHVSDMQHTRESNGHFYVMDGVPHYWLHLVADSGEAINYIGLLMKWY